MFHHNHYVPILKGKLGEYGALESLADEVRNGLTPVIEVVPESRIDNMAARLARSWPVERPLFLDATLMGAALATRETHPLSRIINDARERGVAIIPVIGLGVRAPLGRAVRDAMNRDNLGVCLRMTDEYLGDAEELEEHLDRLVQELGTDKGQCDLLLDYRFIRWAAANTTTLAARALLRGLPSVGEWRTLTVAGSAFPPDLSQAPRGVSQMERSEWAMWRRLASKPSAIPRVPAFGDYAVNHPELREVDFRVMLMTANIRYTIAEQWLILKGRNTRNFGFGQFVGLCRALIQHEDYAGNDFSWGDDYIERCSTGDASTGNATTWRRVGTSHHLTFVTRQIANSAGS